ncbi:hypothetical protein GXP67_17520 [Rhodocytophaga rosea]|uniref:Uncharacterized protein n=1 Tax=Rhodocytophaga rosea TaxID=2704465 RepID=A0A6C0GJQ8_9BACT|nr:DUF6508 domain-containing protein [Rhodocytophaga rosea]QHT68311.1 hypothetical protein GXP67_17520 [Rhodocytophaga rosea]
MSEQTQAIQGLLRFLPLLQNHEAVYDRIGYWGDMTSRVSATTARDLFQYLYRHGFILENFDWMQWSDHALAFEEDRSKLSTADLPTLYKIITTHIRADRFTEGHYDSILENGFLADVLLRFKEISELRK